MTVQPLNAESLVERRRLRRSRSVWRVLAVVLAVAMIGGLIASFTGLGDRLSGGDHIARVELNGFIDFNDPLLELLEALGEDDDTQAVILRVNSPGGIAVAGEALFEALRDLNDDKPVVTVIDGMGTSAAYLAASATEHIVARNGSIVGSIGVLMQFPDVSGLLDHIGVTMHEVRSGELKAQPSVFAPPSEEAVEALNALISDNFDWFVDQIEERRGLTEATIRGFEGTVFTGTRAQALGLVDAIGGEEEAKAYLASEHSIDSDTNVIDRTPDIPLTLAAGPIGDVAAVLGLGEDGAQLRVSADGLREAIRDTFMLDGILSLWHGQ